MPCCLTAPHALLRTLLHSAARPPDAASAVNLELVTLTEDRAVITWYTGVESEGEVVYGTHPAHLNRTASEG
ncbi:metallophosphoesterase, partial [Streptomyces anthocyanicus]